MNELRLGSRRDLRNGALLLGLLIPFSVGLAVLGGRVSYLALGLSFWGVILIVRGFRLRREAWEAEHVGSPNLEGEGQAVIPRPPARLG